jgi:hypothetical protein
MSPRRAALQQRRLSLRHPRVLRLRSEIFPENCKQTVLDQALCGVVLIYRVQLIHIKDNETLSTADQTDVATR